MDVYFLIITGGIIGGNIGPLPATIEECFKYAEERSIERDEVVKTGINLQGEKLSIDQINSVSKLEFTCVELDKRPTNGKPYP